MTVMAMLLTGSTTDFGGFAVPTESAFRICFVVGVASSWSTAPVPMPEGAAAR